MMPYMAFARTTDNGQRRAMRVCFIGVYCMHTCVRGVMNLNDRIWMA
jgi:hypothetical protein